MRRTLVLTALALVLLCSPAVAAGPTVRSTLSAQLAAGKIDQAAYDGYIAVWDDAQATLKRLKGSGRRYAELKSVLATVDTMAAKQVLIAERLPVVFKTVQANRTWWADRPLLSYGQRVTFGDSILQWQAYPGEGLQIQWLATFGKANALWSGRRDTYDAKLGKLLDETTALSTFRNGQRSWEYLFHFDGGSPPWVSGMAQGTALEAYARAAIRLHRPELFDVARQALWIFQARPPSGVAVRAGAGTHYLIYSFAPKLRVLNAFTQSLIGLYDFATRANDDAARGLFAAGEARLRQELPTYDTGAWSLYRPGKESDLGYHTLVRDLLNELCDRLRGAPEGAPAADVYCTTAQRFTDYLKTPPALKLVSSTRPRLKKKAGVRFSLSKVSVVTLTVRRDGKQVYSSSVRFGRGTHTFSWGPPAKKGPVSVTVRAADLAGNVSTVTGSQDVAG